MGGKRAFVMAGAVAAVVGVALPMVAGPKLASDVGAIGGATRLPNGWALDPAGIQVNTERATTGVAVTPDGQGVYAVTSGIFDEAVESIDATTLTAVPTMVSAAFEGVLADGQGHVWTSSGPENEIFEYLGAPGAPLVDARQAGPAPQEPNRGIAVTGYPGQIIAAPGYSRLFVAGTLSVPAKTLPTGESCPAGSLDDICAVVNVVDDAADPTATPSVHVIPVGRDAYAMAFLPSAADQNSGTLYVSNWADQTDPARSGASSLADAVGTVSVVGVGSDGNGQEQSVVPVGKAPMGLALSPDHSMVVVANSASDTLSVIPVDPGTGAVDGAVQTVWVGAGAEGDPLGTQPVAVSFSPDGSHLFVALAGLDAVEVLQVGAGTVTPVPQPRAGGSPATYIPTGWWPASLAIGPEPSVTLRPHAFRMYVANLKGQGAGPGYYGQLQPNVGTGTEGTVSAIDIPTDPAAFGDAMTTWTDRVVTGDHLAPIFAASPSSDPTQDPCLAAPGASHQSKLLCDASAYGLPQVAPAPSATHVIFLLAENKTFDSYFGDTGAALRSNADPSFNEYPLPVTTNQHRLAGQYTLSDNFWNEGAESSVVGHSWWSSGVTTPELELTWGMNYDQGLRGNRNSGQYALGSGASVQSVSLSGPSEQAIGQEENLMANPYATLADEAGGANLSVRVFATDVSPLGNQPSNSNQVDQPVWGEGASKTGDPDPTPNSDLAFPDSDRVQIFLHGQTPVSHAWDLLDGPPPSSFGHRFPSDTLAQQLGSGGYTLDSWTAAYDACMSKTGATDAACQAAMPNFMYMTLPENHTYDVSNVLNPLNPTPQSMVADNDYAIGELIDGLSHSPFWKNTVVFLSEDDNQFTGDHVDIHRTFLLTMGGLANQLGTKGQVSHQPGSFPSALKTAEILLGLPPLTLFDWRAAPLQDVIGDGVPADAPKYTAVVPPTPFLGAGPLAKNLGSGLPAPVGPTLSSTDPAATLSQLPGG